MLKNRLTNKSFAHLGIVLLVLVVAEVGGAGAYVYHSDHKTKPETTDNMSTSTSSSTKATSPPTSTSTTTITTPPTAKPNSNTYAGWKTYTSSADNLNYKYPNDWKLIVQPANRQALGPATVEIDYLSPTTNNSGVNGNNFVLNLTVQNTLGTPTQIARQNASDTKQIVQDTLQTLTNGVITATDNIANAKETTETGTTQYCPGLQIMSKDSKGEHLYYPLGNGDYLNVVGTYCWGQNSTTTYSYQQQLSSQYWQTAIDILSSIRK